MLTWNANVHSIPPDISLEVKHFNNNHPGSSSSEMQASIWFHDLDIFTPQLSFGHRPPWEVSALLHCFVWQLLLVSKKIDSKNCKENQIKNVCPIWSILIISRGVAPTLLKSSPFIWYPKPSQQTAISAFFTNWHTKTKEIHQWYDIIYKEN